MNVIEKDDWRDFVIDGDVCLGDIETSYDAHNARLNLLEECTRIRSQIAQNAIENTRGLDWNRRARAAISFKGVAMQRLQLMAGELAKRERMAVSERRRERLIHMLRDHIGDDAFMAIVARLDDSNGE